MLNCPRCQSPNILSNKPLTQTHLARAADFAQFLQKFGDKRMSVLAGIGALGMQGINALYRDARCRDCGYTFDLGGDGATAA